MGKLNKDESESLMIVAIVALIAAIFMTLIISYNVRELNERKIFVEKGYEQVFEPGNPTPIWKKVK